VSIYASAEPITYGPELEFTNKEIKEGIEGTTGSLLLRREAKWAGLLVKEIRTRCGRNCRFERIFGKYGFETRVHFQNGFYFQVSWDPGVVEIIAKPSTLKELKENAEDVKKYLYDSAHAVGLTGTLDNGGHVNVGLDSAFSDDAELFLKYFVDYANHPELALGILGHSVNNGPPLSILQPEQRAALSKIVRQFYNKELNTLEDVIEAIQTQVYTHSYKWDNSQHYQSVGLKSIPKEPKHRRRIEHRSVRSQESFEQFIAMAELIEHRHQFLKKNKNKIIYYKSDETFFTYQQQLNLFWVYTKDMGLNYQDYLILLGPYVRDLKPNIVFNREIDWNSWLDQDEILWWTKQIFKSDWIRSKLLEILARPEAQSKSLPAQAINTLKKMVQERELGSPFIDDFVADFIRELNNKLQPPQNGCDAHLRGAHHPQQ
jgi:hypothetical protein